MTTNNITTTEWLEIISADAYDEAIKNGEPPEYAEIAAKSAREETERLFRNRERARKYLANEPLTKDDVRVLKALIERAFKGHKSNAKRRGIPFQMTRLQWASTWINAGTFPGLNHGMVMARNQDLGAYVLGNTSIMTASANTLDAIRWRKEKAVAAGNCNGLLNPT